MKMEILRFMHYGIKRSKEVRLNHFLTEISIQKKKSIKYCTSESGRYDFRSRDRSGHGTHVASICAGINGVAPEAELIVVKLGDTREKGFPRTTQLMTALQYVINEASQAGRPVAVNISYGHNYGDHRGNSLLERFISQIAQQWKCTICIGTGMREIVEA